MASVFEIISDISENNWPQFSRSEIDGVYNIWFVMEYFSSFPDCIGIVNEANTMKKYLSKYEHYLFLHGLMEKKKRFRNFNKKKARNNNEKLDIIKTIYNYSNEMAREASHIIGDKEIEEIKNYMNVGGSSNKKVKKKNIK